MMFCWVSHECTNFVTGEAFATKAPRHKVPRRISFILVDDSYFAKGRSILLHERIIILFPNYHFYPEVSGQAILHWIFYILHFNCHRGAKAQSSSKWFHAKLARRQSREGVFISLFWGIEGTNVF